MGSGGQERELGALPGGLPAAPAPHKHAQGSHSLQNRLPFLELFPQAEPKPESKCGHVILGWSLVHESVGRSPSDSTPGPCRCEHVKKDTQAHVIRPQLQSGQKKHSYRHPGQQTPALESVLGGTSSPPLPGHGPLGSNRSGPWFPHLRTASCKSLWCSEQGLTQGSFSSWEHGALPEQKGLSAGEGIRLASCSSGRPRSWHLQAGFSSP